MIDKAYLKDLAELANGEKWFAPETLLYTKSADGYALILNNERNYIAYASPRLILDLLEGETIIVGKAIERRGEALGSEARAVPDVGGLTRDAVRDAVAEALSGTYYCGRVWSAWGVGTMSEDDFTPAAEVDDVLDGIVDAAIGAMPVLATKAAAVEPAAPPPDWRAYHSALSKCAELLDNMADGDPLTDTPKFLATKLAEAVPAAPEQAAQALLTRIDDAFENYERFGQVCEFEGHPMIYASTLHEIIDLRGKVHVASLAAAPVPPVPAPAEQGDDEPLFYPPKALLNREDWDPLTRKPKVQTEQPHVMPPMRGTDSQHEACRTCGVEVGGQHAPDCVYEGMAAKGFPGKGAAGARKLAKYGPCRCTLSQYCDGKCNPVFADELASRCRAPGGNTSEESGSGLAHVARQAQADAPAAWMRANRKECTTAESKKQMENAGFGAWGEIAKEYTIPLYELAPVAQEVGQHDDQQFERGAELRVNEAGLGGSAINPNATSMLDIFDADAQEVEPGSVQPIAGAFAWFHRGMVNFDEQDALKALDDGKGTPITLYLAAPSSTEASSQAAPTDLSKRLRLMSKNQKADGMARILIQAADEIDRYYGGMLAWKRTAEAKDGVPAAAQAAPAEQRDAALEDAVQAVAERAGDSETILVISAFDAIRGLKKNRFAMPSAGLRTTSTAAQAATDQAKG